MKSPDHYQKPERTPASTTTTASVARKPSAIAEVAPTTKAWTEPERTTVIGNLHARSVWTSGKESVRLFYDISVHIVKGTLSRSQPCYSVCSAKWGKGGLAMRQLIEMNNRIINNNDTNAVGAAVMSVAEKMTTTTISCANWRSIIDLCNMKHINGLDLN